MTAGQEFGWARAARLYAGAEEVPRPVASGDGSFRLAPASPTSAALPSLVAALADRAPFCLSEQTLPTHVTAGSGQFLTLTGGSSGAPKVVRRSHASWIASFETNARLFTFTDTDSVAVLGALSHSLALYGVLEGLHLGLDTHVLDALSPRAQAARLAETGVRLLYATPTQLRLLVRGAGAGRLPDLRLVLCGGGALDAATRDAVRRLCPNAKLHEFYGAAETSFITLGSDDTPAGSVGRAYPGVELRLLDGKGHPTDGPGEVWVRSPYLFDGYAYSDSPETRWQDGFVTVGEVGRLDAAGNLTLLGRRNRAVNVADELVFSEVVEATLGARAGRPCAVLPEADALRGTALVAVVEGAGDQARATALLQDCRAALGPRATPRRLLFHPELPRLPSGKTDLAALARWLENEA